MASRPEPSGDPAGGNLPGRASRQDLTHFQRESLRRVLLVLPSLRRAGFAARELVRRVRRAPHVVELFHQVDDPYSQLALEAATRLLGHYAIELRFHLVSRTDRLHAPEPELLAAYARRDCARVAPHYGLEFPRDACAPSGEDVQRVERLLAGRLGARPFDGTAFLADAIAAGRSLWQPRTAGDRRKTHADRPDAPRAGPTRLERAGPIASPEETERALAAGNALRTRRGH